MGNPRSFNIAHTITSCDCCPYAHNSVFDNTKFCEKKQAPADSQIYYSDIIPDDCPMLTG